MYKNNNLLVEIGTEELPIKNLVGIGKDFVKYFSFELKKNKFNFFKIKYFITLNRISCLVFNLKIDKINNEKLLIIPKILKFSLIRLSLKRETMKWGNNNFSFIRPIKNIIIMLDNFVIKEKLFGIKSNNISYCNKNTIKSSIIIDNANNYVYCLFKNGKIIVNYKDRKNKIKKFLFNLSLKKKLYFKYKKEFLDIVTSLVEFPVCILCNFNKKYLFLYEKIIIYILQKKYYFFPVFDNKKNISNYFVVISNANVYKKNYNLIKKGYEKTINLIFKDILFLLKLDRKIPFYNYLKKLKFISFHEKLGSLYDKTKRIQLICKFIVNYLNINLNKKILFKSILLSKCDLATFLYKEYNDLKGIIGMYYCLLDGKNKEICLAIKNHYLPKNYNDNFPKDIYSNIISFSDKIDTIVGIMLLENKKYIILNKKSNDPFFLRRLSSLVLKILLFNKFNINFIDIIKFSVSLFKKFLVNKSLIKKIVFFIFKRCLNIFINQGYKKKIIISFLNLKNFDILDIKKRMDVLLYKNFFNKFNCLILFSKRIKNFLNKNICYDKKYIFSKKLLIKKEEKDLYEYIVFLEKEIFFCYKNYNYKYIINLLFFSLSKLIYFFDNVRINVNNIKLKNNRIIILKKILKIYYSFCDFSIFY